jgi:hypothetical protein
MPDAVERQQLPATGQRNADHCRWTGKQRLHLETAAPSSDTYAGEQSRRLRAACPRVGFLTGAVDTTAIMAGPTASTRYSQAVPITSGHRPPDFFAPTQSRGMKHQVAPCALEPLGREACRSAWQACPGSSPPGEFTGIDSSVVNGRCDR